MMRSWENREDTVVVDEPFYAAYLLRTGIDHPGRETVIASQPTDPAEVVAALHAPLPDGVTVHYAKQMTHHLADDMDLAWTRDFRNVLLIRDPAEVVASYVRSRESCEPEDIGLLQQVRLLDSLRSGEDAPPVIDAGDFLRDPEGYLRWLCDWLGIGFTPADAGLAGGSAQQRRGLGAVLVRRGVALDRVRAVAPARGVAGPARRGRRGGLPSRLRPAGGAPTSPLTSLPRENLRSAPCGRSIFREE